MIVYWSRKRKPSYFLWRSVTIDLEFVKTILWYGAALCICIWKNCYCCCKPIHRSFNYCQTTRQCMHVDGYLLITLLLLWLILIPSWSLWAGRRSICLYDREEMSATASISIIPPIVRACSCSQMVRECMRFTYKCILSTSILKANTAWVWPVARCVYFRF